MEYRKLPHGNEKISIIGLGAMNLHRVGINYLEDSQVPNTVTDEHVLSVKGAVSHPMM